MINDSHCPCADFKKTKEGNCEVSLDEKVVEEKENLLRDVHTIFETLRMDEGTYEEL